MSGTHAPAPEGAWVVADIPGGVLADAPPTIAFADGRVSGRAGVNRFAGAYSLDGALLALGPLAMTRMAGPPERMEQEARLAAALQGTLTLSAAEGALLLEGPAGVLRLEPATSS